jgi:hypothetical protein
MANCKNLEFILQTIKDNPGISTTTVRKRLCARNGKTWDSGRYMWYFAHKSIYQNHGGGGMDYAYWTKVHGIGKLTLTTKGLARLAKF